MKVLMLNWRDLANPRSGGAEVVTEEVLKRLVERGHTVTLFTATFPGCKAEETIDGYRVIRRGSEMTVHLHAFLYWLRAGKHEGYTHIVDQIHGIPFFTPLYIRSNESPTTRPSSLATRHSLYSLLRSLPATSPPPPRVVALNHEVAREIWLRMHRFPIGRIGYILEPYFYLPYKRIPFITVSHATKRDLVKAGIPAEHISIIPEAVTVTPLTREPKKDPTPTIIFVGRIAKMKGVHHLLEAYTIAKKSIPDLRLWLVGGGDEYKAKLEAQYKGDPDVTFYGFVSEEKKLELLERATILSSASMKEGYGLVIIEAAAMGTPSVVYNVDGFNEAVVDGQTGVLTDPTPQALATGIVSLLGDPSDSVTHSPDYHARYTKSPVAESARSATGDLVCGSLLATRYSLLQSAAHARSHDFTFDHTTDVFEKLLTHQLADN